MVYTLLRDAPKGTRCAVLAVVLLACLLMGGGGGYALRGLVSQKGPASLSSSPTQSPSALSSPSSPRHVFLFVGDSNTEWGASVADQGWVSHVQADYARFADIINRGIAGDTTRNFIKGALPGLREELTGWLHQPWVITLWLGANDAADKTGRHGWLNVPLDEYKENLATILKDLRRLAPNSKIILMTPPPVDADMRRDTQEKEGYPRDPPDRTNEVTGTYAAACKEVGDATPGITTLDIYGEFMAMYPNATERASVLLKDGLHLTAAGNAAVYKLLVAQHI